MALAGQLIDAGLGTVSSGAAPAPNSEPLGARTGAPVRTALKSVQVAPAGGPSGSTLVVEPTRESRVITFVAPLVDFSIFIGDAGVQPGGGLSLPPGLPYDIVLPGLQPLYAVTNAPVYLSLRVQIAPILIGDNQRRL